MKDVGLKFVSKGILILNSISCLIARIWGQLIGFVAMLRRMASSVMFLLTHIYPSVGVVAVRQFFFFLYIGYYESRTVNKPQKKYECLCIIAKNCTFSYYANFCTPCSLF